MSVSAAAVKELRDKTGAGVLDCRSALAESGGDMEKAEGILRQRGVAMAEKKAGRETRQGLVEAYIHPGGRYGALVEVNCETDFVARTDTFKELVRDLAMHITATNPALDGGRLLFVLISVVTRRRPRPEVEGMAHALGMAALLTLVFVVSWREVMNLINNRPVF